MTGSERHVIYRKCVLQRIFVYLCSMFLDCVVCTSARQSMPGILCGLSMFIMSYDDACASNDDLGLMRDFICLY